MVDTDSTTVTMARPEDPGVAPLLAGLLAEYTERYGPGAAAEFDRNPTSLFTEERGGALVLLVEGGQTVAGGALRAFDHGLAAKGIIDTDLAAPAAEFKRIWTHAEHRRRGLGRRVLSELERRAADLGYRQVFLTTGPKSAP